MDKVIVLDIGTNTVIFSVIEPSKNSLIIPYEKSITTRIGQNISTSSIISAEAMERTLDIIDSELKIIQKKFGKIKTFAMATEALRTANNVKECLEKLNTVAGTNIELISGKQEALYTLEAVKDLYNVNSGTVAVCDIGGGSTEINILFNGQNLKTESIPLGVVRLEEEFRITNNPDNAKLAFEKIKTLLGPVFERVDRLILCGGTGTTVASIILGLDEYDPTLVEGTKLSKEILDTVLFTLLDLNLDQLRKILITDTGRADVITAGVLIMKVMNELFTPKDFVITTLGPRHGMAIKNLGLEKIDGIDYRLTE